MNDPSKIYVLQGSGGLPSAVKPPNFVLQDPNLPSIDGRQTSARQMFMFAFNDIGPHCCPSPVFGSRGCVCVTPEQNDLIANRGVTPRDSSDLTARKKTGSKKDGNVV